MVDPVKRGSVSGARELLSRIEHELGVGVLVGGVEEGEPWRIYALLTFGALQQEIEVTADSEAEAWGELARRVAAWRTSNEVSLTNQYWGG